MHEAEHVTAVPELEFELSESVCSKLCRSRPVIILNPLMLDELEKFMTNIRR